ncbi:MAG TPA: hypothetical protein VGT24_13145 [Candidatus Acidoferrales bacterium]|nr:hypothetical protein [Candidatus Acidoferrales bacterium]
MPKKTSTQREAERLAKFLALEPGGVERFRRDNPRFAPAKWWSYQPTDSVGKILPEMQWQLTQKFLHEAWDDGFDLDLFELTRLLLCVFDPASTEAGIFNDPIRPAFAGLKEIADDWGFHIGVRYLAEHPWTAKVCEEKECERPFVADIPPRKYCFEKGADGLRCSERVIRRTHLKNWHEKGDKQRRERLEAERKAAKKKTAR